jgi:hypothetical protein
MADQDKKREISVRVLLTAKEKQELQKAADRASLPLAIYLRIAGLEKARAGTPSPLSKG